MGKCHRDGVGLGVHACAAALVCVLHGGVLLPFGFAHVEDAGRREHACVRAHACVGACLCSRARLHTRPRVCPRRLPAVAHRRQRVRARAGRGGGGVLGHAHAHVGGCPHMQPCALHLPGGLCTPGPCASRCRGMTHGLAEEAVTQSWIPASPHPPAGRPSRPRGACGTRAAAGTARRGRVPGAGAPRRTAGSGAGGDVPLRGNAGSLRGRGGPSGAREEAAPGARGGDAHALTPAQAGHWVQARARFPGVFRAVPAVHSPG